MIGPKTCGTAVIRTEHAKIGTVSHHICHEGQDLHSEKILAEIKELKKERDDALKRAAECREDLEVWMECTSLLSTIAGVDYDCYRNAFLEVVPTSSSPKDEHGTTDGSVLGGPIIGAQKRLDEIQNRWSLNDTTLLNLLQSIHRLQSNGCNLHRETEEVCHELSSAKRELYHCQTHNQQLQEAMKKLHGQNKKLKDKIQRKKIERMSLMKNVGDYVSTIQRRQSVKAQQHEEYEEREIAKQLKVHERLLRMNKYRKNEMSSEPLDSSDNYDIRDSGMCFTPSFDDDETDADGDSLSIVSSSNSSVSSVRSLVTNDISSTVRLESCIASEKKQFDHSLDGGRKRTKSDGDVAGWSSLSLTGGQRRSIISNEMLSMDQCPAREGRKLRTSSDGDVSTSGWSSLSFSAKNSNNKITLLQDNVAIDDSGDDEAKSGNKNLSSMFHLPKISLPHKETSNLPKVDDDNVSNASGNSYRDGNDTCKSDNGESKKEAPSHTPSFLERFGVERKETTTPSCKYDNIKGCEKDDSSMPTPESRTPSFLAKMGVMSDRVSPLESESDMHESEENRHISSSMKMISPPSFLRSKEKNASKKSEKEDGKDGKSKPSSSFLSPITLTTTFNNSGVDEEESKDQNKTPKSTKEAEIDSSVKINSSMKNMSQKFKSLF